VKKSIAFVLVLVFLFITGITLADEEETRGTCEKSGAELNCMANWLTSHFPSWERSKETKEAAVPLSKEELKMQRENTGMGMRGRVGN